MAVETINRIAGEAEQSRSARETARARADRLTANLPVLRASCKAAERAASLSDATADAAAVKLRSALMPGEPCPVCGGTDHAVEALLGLIDGRVELDAKARENARRDVSAAERDAAVQVDRVATATARLQQLGMDASAAALVATASRAAHHQAVVALDESAAKAGVVIENLAVARRATDAQLVGIDEERRTLTSALAFLDIARGNAERARLLQETAAADAMSMADALRSGDTRTPSTRYSRGCSEARNDADLDSARSESLVGS